MIRRLAPLLLAILFSCTKKTETPAVQPKPEPEPELPALPDFKVRDLDKLDTEKYIEAPAPATAPLRWDFSPAHRYPFRATVDQLILFSTLYPEKKAARNRLKGTGTVEFARGRAVFEAHTTEAWNPEGPVPHDKIQEMKPTRFEYSVREDSSPGEARAESDSTEADLIEMLFRLPQKALAPGETEESKIDKRTPTGRQTGTLRTTLTGFFKVQRYECARLVTEVNLDIPPQGKVTGKGVLKGRIVAYFAAAERHFVRVEAAFTSVLYTKAQVETENGGPLHWYVGSNEWNMLVQVRYLSD